eukprot:CAMPEP_0196825896 /NCGR_PEP_ID=MMETSP1362-20130617/93318_1 /TAXON_ID=163516 /ORGANISM="Leptocylindrus danicus, Strain CCMP1856" /LENGTH=99 /DNA_ID=CAMNT_0042206403 /DNA_START=3981 /DNA_END=4280 /DNA_ORIENTATION=-
MSILSFCGTPDSRCQHNLAGFGGGQNGVGAHLDIGRDTAVLEGFSKGFMSLLDCFDFVSGFGGKLKEDVDLLSSFAVVSSFPALKERFPKLKPHEEDVL